MGNLDNEIVQCFLDDAKELLRTAERILLEIEKGEGSADAINELFRVAHNIKGSARAVGFEDLSHFTHRLESVLVRIKKGECNTNSPMVTSLLKSIDHLNESLDHLRENPEAGSAAGHAALLPYLEKMLICEKCQRQHAGDPTADSLESACYMDRKPYSEVAVVEAQPRPSSSSTSLTAATITPSPSTTPSSSAVATTESLRVPLTKVERLLNDIGELVILQTVMSQNQRSLGSIFLSKTVMQMEKIIRDIQSNSMSLRMVSIKPLFQKLERIVHDTSHELGKDIRLISQGGEMELDKTMLEQISDPLVHIIRNAVDHGIEAPADRQQKGKASRGTLELVASQQGGQMVIEVRDDGRGLDGQKILAHAKSKGLIPENQSMNEDEARQLIFMPGFSTKTEVTSTSGRGVGMDVVKTNVEALQGRIEIYSKVGEGSVFRLLLPLTLAIIEGVIVESAGQRYVVPLSQIQQYFHPHPKEIVTVAGRGEILNHKGESIPLLRLNRLMGTYVDTKLDAKEESAKSHLGTVLMIQTRKIKASLMVDRVLRQQQIVIKKLSPDVRGTPGVMGGAILGDGRVALILDLQDWVDRHLNADVITDKNRNKNSSSSNNNPNTKQKEVS